MADFHCHFFALVHCFVHLAYGSGGYWNWVKLFEDILYIASICLFEVGFSRLKGMSRSIFTEILEFRRQVRPDNISSMAKILKCLDEHNSGSLNCLNKEIHPIVLGSLEQKQRECDDRRQKYYQQLKESDHMYNGKPDS